MALTDFGKAIRKARIDTDTNISSMAEELNVSAAFLSGVEMGRKKVPAALIGAVEDFFAKRGHRMPDLHQLAAVANKSVPIEGLSHSHQMLVAGFARATLDEQTLQNMSRLLAAANNGGKKVDR